MKKINDIRIGSRLTILLSIGISLVLTVLGIYLYTRQYNYIIAETDKNVTDHVENLSNLVDLQIKERQNQIGVAMEVAADEMFHNGDLKLNKLKLTTVNAVNQIDKSVTQIQVPEFLRNNEVVNENVSLVDKITRLTNAKTTIFLRTDVGYLRISTTVMKEDGSRAVGTYIPFDEADASEGEITERVIPTGNIELMFHYGLPFHVKRSEAKSDSQPRSFVSGISSTYSDVSSSGETGVIAVTFFPFGACNFFRFPLDEIQNSTVSLRQIYSSSFKFIEEKISEVPLINDRIKIIEEFLTKHLHPINPNDFSFLKQSLALINSSRGVITATELSQQLCLSSKSLERKFTHFLGKTPKQFLKIIRFQEILKSLSAGDNILLTEIAYEKGYFDQAHFIKDFKMYTGYTPREFVAIYPCNSGYSGSEYF